MNLTIKWQDKLTVTKTVPFPEYDFGLDWLIWKDSTLEACYQTTIRHNTRRKLKIGLRLLADREYHLIISSGRAFGNLHALSQVSG